MSSRPSATLFLRRILLSCAAAVMAVALPHGQGQPQAPTAASPADPYPNFDIRGYKADPRLAGNEALAAYVAAVAPASPAAADALTSSANGRAALRNDLPGAVVEADALGGAAIVSAMPGSPFLSGPGDDRVGTLRAFVQSHAAAYGVAGGAASLVVVADEMNPAGNMAWVEFEQRLHGIPVFQGHLRGAFTAKGELARTNGLLATGVEGLAPQAADLSATQAVAIAAANVGLPAGDLKEASRDADIVHFARGAMAGEPDARLVYFPIAPGVVRLAWQTQVFGDPLSFLTVVDAATGTVVFRKSLTDFQTQAATYNVYTSDSPAPGTPTTSTPATPVQAPYVSRTDVTLIGNEAPNTFNNLGWITDGGNVTDGNNVEAGLDRDTTNGVDATVAGSPARVFTATYAPGTDDPLSAQHQRGSVIDMFYWVNRYHDDTYRLGFTEAFRNFQNDNFGRGGAASDRVSAEGQDGSGTNNANFNTPADGGRGRMQMFLWTGPTPDLDGTIDHEIVIHELTHGLSNRLHANASGLSTNMARGMGEGWSDFYARALLADSSEPVNAVYAMGGWATHLAASGYTANYYYGIRRFPYAPISFTGGPGNRPHNPLTFADIDSTQANLGDGAYARGPFGVATFDGVHNIGEVWASMLYEVRVRFITRLGFAEGNRRILQFVTDGMKGDPVGPTLLQARDSIIAAANSGGGTAADIADIWAGFAARGLGVTATIENAGGNSSTNLTRVTESFLRPGDALPTFTVNDVTLTEGNVGTKTFAFTVTLANPSTNTPTVSFTTANGSATSSAGAPVGTSTGAIALPGGAPTTTTGVASPYPVPVTLAGLTGTITKVGVRLNGLTHTFPADLDMLLVGPGGQRAMFMSDVGDGGDISGLTLTFEDGAAAPPTGQLVAGTYAPTDLATGETMTAPAPAGPYTSALSVFNGTNPNGTWNLYVVDDAGSDVGSLASYTLIVGTTTSPGDYTATSGTLSFPPGTTTQTVNVTVLGDVTPEPNETFFVNLSNPGGAVIGDGQGVGTSLNDDGAVPTVTNDAYITAINTPLIIAAPGVIANDNANGLGPLSALLVTPPSHGGVTLAPDGGFTYTPTGSYSGADSFVYRVEGTGGASSDLATVSLTVSAVTTVQPALNFYVANVVGNRVTLRWTTPPAGPAPTSYVLEGGVTPGAVIATLPLGPLPLFTFDAPSGAFYVRLRSVAGADVSGASNEVPLFVNVAVPPSAPANLLGTVDGSSLSLQWRNTFAGGAAAGAILDVSGPATLSMPLGATETFSFAGVPSGTYNLSVRSANAGGSGAASNVVTLTFPSGCTGAPSAPSKFLAYASGPTLNLVWESPTSGAAAASYVIDATGAISTSVPVGGTALSSPVPSGTYNLSVRAVNACGSSAPTAVQTVTIP